MKRKVTTKFPFRFFLCAPLIVLTGLVCYRGYRLASFLFCKNFTPQSIVVTCKDIYSVPVTEEITLRVLAHLTASDYSPLSIESLYQNLRKDFKIIKDISWRWDRLEEAALVVEGVKPFFKVNDTFVFGSENRLLPSNLFSTGSLDSLRGIRLSDHNIVLANDSPVVSPEVYEFLQNIPDHYWDSYTVSYSGHNNVFLLQTSGKEAVRLVVGQTVFQDDNKLCFASLIHEDFMKKQKKERWTGKKRKRCLVYDLRFKNRIYAKSVPSGT